MALWGTSLIDTSTITAVAKDLPKWLQRTVAVQELRLEDGVLTLQETSFKPADMIMIVVGEQQSVYKVSDVDGDKHTVELVEGEPIESNGETAIIMQVYPVEDIEGENCIIPITVEDVMLDQDDPEHPLANIGINAPGWWHHRCVRAEDGSVKVFNELLVSVRSLTKTEEQGVAPMVDADGTFTDEFPFTLG